MTSDATDRADLTALLAEHRFGQAGPTICTCGWSEGPTKNQVVHRAHVADAVLAAGWRRAEGGADSKKRTATETGNS